MFKPSLRKSILNDNLSIQTHKTHQLFNLNPQPQQKPIINTPILATSTRQNVEIPSMIIPQRLLSETKFDIDHHPDTKIFTPFTYDFTAYPRAIRDYISPNPKAAQAGKCQQLNFVVYQKSLFLWIDNKKDKSLISSQSGDGSIFNNQNGLLKMHKFSQIIDLIQVCEISNGKLFTINKAIILAIVFKNRIKMFIVNMKDLSLEDMMLRFQLKGARKIQQVNFTADNQIIISGDNGKLLLISLLNSANSSSIVNFQQNSNYLPKYLNKSAFDYSTVYNMRQIISNGKFIYCLYDRIRKENYLLYLVKKAVNSVVKLQEEPKYILNQTFVDVYSVEDSQKKKHIRLVDRIQQKLIEEKVKDGYTHFTGESIPDAFRIVAIKPKVPNYVNKITNQSKLTTEEETNQKKKVQETGNTIMQVVTKCGYLISLIHKARQTYNEKSGNQNGKAEGNNHMVNQNQNQVSFTQQPIKLPSVIGPSHLLELKQFSHSQTQKSTRKNFVIKSIPSQSINELVLLMSDSIMRIGQNGQVNVIKFRDLKIKVAETTKEKSFYLDIQQFNKNYNKTQAHSLKQRTPESNKGLFPIFSAHPSHSHKPQYYRLFNTQRRFTSFDNEGGLDIYLLELRHIILAYLSYYTQAKTRANKDGNHSTLAMLNGGIDYDIKLQKIMQKILHSFGYCQTIKSLIQILTINSNNDRQFIFFQRNLLIDTIKKEFQSDQLGNIFDDWNHSLSHHQESHMIVVNDTLLDTVWGLLYEWHLRAPLTRETVRFVPFLQAKSDKNLARQWVDDIKAKQKFTSYANALNSLFNQQLQTLSQIPTHQFKQKQATIKDCQAKLIRLHEFIEEKGKKSAYYRTLIEAKLSSLSKKETKANGKKSEQSLSMQTLNSSGNSQQTTVYMYGEDESVNRILNGDSYITQSNSIAEDSLMKSIQKIVVLIDVMSVLIEKDLRQGVPTILQVITQYESQLKCGQVLFKEQLLMMQNGQTTFIHPELIQRVLKILPELEINKKIQFLKFKISRNLLTHSEKSSNTSQIKTEIDLKSLDLQRLAQLISTQNLPELNRTFLSEQLKEFNLNKGEYYIKFLSVCLTQMIAKINQLVDIKGLKFTHISQEVKKNQTLSQQKDSQRLTTNFSLQKIVLAQQKLAYFQTQMIAFYEQVVKVFKLSVDYLLKITGPEYYETQKYLERIIEFLVCTFPNEEILIQTIKNILKAANMIDKVQYVRTTRKKMEKHQGMGRIFVDLSHEKQAKIRERSTFEYFLNRTENHSNSLERTIDTLKNAQKNV